MGICGNVPTNEMKGFSGIRQNGFQEMDIISMTRNTTKYSVTANSAEGFPDVVERAYNMALLGRRKGVCIDFPLDIQQADITPSVMDLEAQAQLTWYTSLYKKQVYLF